MGEPQAHQVHQAQALSQLLGASMMLPKNACKPCDGQESACGNDDPNKYFCLAAKEPACGSPPTPGGGGYCAADSPQNACGRCPTMSESECGNTQPGVYKCWGLPDQRCHGKANSTFLSTFLI